MAPKSDKPAKLTAKQFLARLKAQGSAAEAEKTQRYFKSGEGEYGEGDKFIYPRRSRLAGFYLRERRLRALVPLRRNDR